MINMGEQEYKMEGIMTVSDGKVIVILKSGERKTRKHLLMKVWYSF